MQLISSSDRISTVQETVMLLNLTTQEGGSGSGKKEDVLVELTKEDLDSLLATLSSANEVYLFFCTYLVLSTHSSLSHPLLFLSILFLPFLAGCPKLESVI